MINKMKNRLQHAWNAFKSNEQLSPLTYRDVGSGYAFRPDRMRLSYGNERSIIAPIYNRISTDVCSLNINHVRLDADGNYLETLKSGLNECLTTSSNLDQTGRNLIQDAVLSMFDEGCVAIVPIETDINPRITGGYDILSLRVGQILEWFPEHIKVRVYNEKTGLKEDLLLNKNVVAIVENPFYAIMNETNSTLKRLIRKLNLLDSIDEQSGSGKLDLLIQLPYVIKSAARKEAADLRRTEIESQLTNSKYGIAYIDGTEKVTQLNRPAENNLMTQIEYLTKMLHSQLGLTESVFDGTADEKTMLNYQTRTIKPILNAIIDEMKRKFLTKTARTQNQSIIFFRDMFELLSGTELAEVADKLTRNEIVTSNEIRAIGKFKPSKEKSANELRNKNLNKEPASMSKVTKEPIKKEEVKNE